MNALAHTQQQKQLKILLIGDNCTDVYQYGTVDRISPEAPVPVFKLNNESRKPGMAGNVKLNLETLGCQVNLISGIESTKTRLIDMRSKQHIVRIDSDETSIELLYSQIKDLLDVDAVVISDYNKGFISYDLVEQLRRNWDGPIFIDTKKVNLERFEGCFVKINELEFNNAKNQCSDLIVTLGEHGARYGYATVPAPRVEVADVCGAGDTFLSALVYDYLTSADMLTAIEFAIKASAITVQHLGCYAPSLEEIHGY